MRAQRLVLIVSVLVMAAGGCRDRAADPDPGREPATVEPKSGLKPLPQSALPDPSREPATVDSVDPSREPATVALVPAPVSPERRLAPPKVAHILTISDLVGVLSEKGWISEGVVPGISPEGHYNSILFSRPGNTHMVAVQLWEYRQREDAVARWNALLATYPNTAINDTVVEDTFFWSRGAVAGLVFLEAGHSRVLALSCHTLLCDDTELLRLALIAHERVR